MDAIRGIAALSCVVAFACAGHSFSAEPDWGAQREALAQKIEAGVRATEHLTGIDSLSPSVMAAIRTTPRHEFVPQDYREQAYQDRPLPIGNGQTISQPYIVALMTDLASVDPTSTVLEIGTGSGYQAAVLAEFVEHVYTIEIIAPLGNRARETLRYLDYDNVTVKIGDGYKGLPEHAPFDAIIVTAAPETVPEPLIEQLAVGGKLVIPVGPQYSAQSLQVLEKQSDGEVTIANVLPVRFVPFTRD